MKDWFPLRLKPSRQQGGRWLHASLAFILLAIACLGLTACQPRLQWGDEQKLLAQVWTQVDRAYVDPTFNGQNWWQVRQTFLRQPMPTPEAAYERINVMLATLGDPFTRFLDPASYRSLQTSTSGELNGVGLQIALDESGGVRVIAPLEGTPADRAGLQTDDRIVAVNDEPVRGWSLERVAARLRGLTGTQVYLSVQRGDRQFEVGLKREAIAINPVRSQIFPQQINGQPVAYIRLSQFNANAVAKMRAAIDRAESAGAVGYILDLRGNPGGLLKAGIEIGRMWIDRGPIVFTIDRNGISDSADATGSQLTDAPLVAIVNRGSASASEVLSGALQDTGRAALVGTRTFGKGLIQSIFEMPDETGLAVTIAKYATPSGRDINHQGIEPDVVVELPSDRRLKREELATERDPQFVAALEVLREQVAAAQALPTAA
ncbi:S41 family peptidase [Synechococcus sp. PCC 7336]|uniref:S41 family peptidase n=1 Tax=Synechococcus sp. PCC 7336 TaxID=195250 RepID=UPI00034AF3C3|nr:S41 family peptidase [Synechococcus sp. PCC 7336]